MSAAAHPSTSSPRRVIVASLLGTSFGRPFFPNVEALTGTLLAFATYAVGFVARPLGGVVFGHFGDRVGRRTCCPAHAEQPDSRHRTPPGGHPADAYPPSGGVRGTGSRTPWTPAGSRRGSAEVRG